MLFNNRAFLLSYVDSSGLVKFFEAVGSFSCHVIQQSAIEESVRTLEFCFVWQWII